jgi:hypothetical protein
MFALVAWTLAAGGCAKGRRIIPSSYRVAVAGTGVEDQDYQRLAVDIDNHAGSVLLIVDPRLEQPVVTATPRDRGKRGAPAWAAASVSDDEGHPVLRILVEDPAGVESSGTDVVVRVPDCGGVRVRNEHGPVVLREVSGAIDVQTSMNSSSAKAISVQTRRKINAPILLRADRGDIELRIGAGSSGRVRAEASGYVNVDSAMTPVTDVRYTRKVWTGTINGGTNDVVASADDGDVFVLVGRW